MSPGTRHARTGMGLALAWLAGCAGSNVVPNGPLSFQTAPFPKIDTHVHVYDPSAAYADLLKRLNGRVLNICVVDKHDNHKVLPQHESAIRLAHATEGRAAWPAALDPKDWESQGFAQRLIAVLDQAFKQGAVGVKIYKDVGMELKSRDGSTCCPTIPPSSQFSSSSRRAENPIRASRRAERSLPTRERVEGGTASCQVSAGAPGVSRLPVPRSTQQDSDPGDS